ncbi:integrase arm-type DNA-binding domain-containing protein [Microbulbifer sp. OS29]|uniref:Integrase arm-type DNA-binding domain-containing protein n=1 Tax=Microbulbifer okhotskensis TaxID=2926617 RepID=A0A9X2EPR1_9GAMM|nr:integrase arm-type DNA-binding domain-containing protein [Microbulbifer okhotskensis]MCO1333488.1 integrase arm-type DNA-binding domain-containing protein [Microbulbifer okhotskensis]
MALTELQVKQARAKEKDYKLSDEKGMFLLVTKTGGRYWRLKYRHPHTKKERKLALGVYPETSLKRARQKRDEARNLILDGIDPSDHRKALQAENHTAATNTFEALALDWFATKMGDKSESHRRRTMRLLERDLFPYLGRRPIGKITPPELLIILKRIEARGAIETAKRAKQTASQVFRFAIAGGKATNDPASVVGDQLQPTQSKNFATITHPMEVGKLLTAIEQYQGTPTVRAALKLSPMLFCRPGELRALEWSEINWTENRIELPAQKMKMRQPHIIPLARQATEVLREIAPLTGRFRYVFPSPRGASRCMSENAVRVALRNMGYGNDAITPHGFRAMARTLLDEVLGERVEWIEHQLAHSVKDANGTAYNRTKHLVQRTTMMQKWADYLDRLKASEKAGNVISANFSNQ